MAARGGVFGLPRGQTLVLRGWCQQFPVSRTEALRFTVSKAVRKSNSYAKDSQDCGKIPRERTETEMAATRWTRRTGQMGSCAARAARTQDSGIFDIFPTDNPLPGTGTSPSGIVGLGTSPSGIVGLGTSPSGIVGLGTSPSGIVGLASSGFRSTSWRSPGSMGGSHPVACFATGKRLILFVA